MNAYEKMRTFIFLSIIITTLVFTTACSDTTGDAVRSSESPIETNFRQFYSRLGGKNLLGEILSPVLQDGEIYYQFTEKVILVFNPQVSTPKQYYLYPVGLEMGFNEPPEPMPADPNTVYYGGFVVWPEAVNLFNRWGRICKPISSLHYNDEQKRFEQYFDCFGVYRSEDEPVGSIHLLDYGAWKCGDACTTYSPSSSGFIPQKIFPDPPSKEDLAKAESIIIIAADRIGRTITGFPLTATYLADNGRQYLKIYENVVFALDRDNSARPYVLAITQSLHVERGKPEKQQEDQNGLFYSYQDNLGYTVKPEFYNFLAMHGSFDTSGAPITNEYALDNWVNRQCFENLCLDYHKKAAEGMKVRPAPLGYVYKQLFYRQELVFSLPVNSTAIITIYPWEASSLIPSTQEQEIGAAVYENYVTVPDVQVILSVRMPDGVWRDFGPQATDESGQTVFILPPIQAPNSTIILYQVCLYGIDEAKNFCVMEDFTIWGNP